MAERSVRTGDDLDTARLIRSLDDRIAALEREQFPTIPEIPEPCCVCESFSIFAAAGGGFASCGGPTSATIALGLAGVEWLTGLPVLGGLGVIPGTPGKWLITAHADVSFEGATESRATLALTDGGSIWELDAKSTINATDPLLDTTSLQLVGTVMIDVRTPSTSFGLSLFALTTGGSFTYPASHSTDHAVRLQGMLYCKDPVSADLPPTPGS